MKKIRLLLVALGLLLAIVSSGQTTTLTFKLANPRVLFNDGSTTGLFIGIPGDYFVFDVQIKAADLGTYMFSGQAMFSFDNTCLSTNPSNWYTTKGPLSSSNRYTLPNPTITGGIANVAWVGADYISSLGFKPVTGSYQAVVTVYALIVDPTGKADIDFVKSPMDGQQFYKNTASSGYGSYVNPNLYDASNFVNTYVGRIYANNQWTQIGGNTDIVPFVNWATAVNTSIWDGSATIPTTGTSLASAVRIHSGATLTVPPTGQLTAASLENNTVNGLTIQSDATNTGSLIATTATGTGTATVQRYMAASSWRIATSPLSGQTIGGFLTANPTVATAPGSLRGMTDYDMANNAWNPFFTNGTADAITVGKGYLLRASTAGAGVVSFNGNLNAGNTNVGLTMAGTNWNCIGNPYTAAVTKTTLLASGVFESGYTALYVFNGLTYDIINLGNGQADIQAGQGFMVKALSATNLAFTPSMEVHDNAAVLKSASVFPEIKLSALNNNIIASTSIKFIAGTTTGLDEGYDAGIFKSDLGLNIYTRLVEDNGIDFGLQCLPNSDFSSMIIPVGIDSKAGGEVVFSTELTNLPSDCKVILEDKLNKTFTDLSKNVYRTTIDVNSIVADRFQIHTSYQTTGLSEAYFNGSLSAYAIRNVEIRVKGEVSNQAVASLYDVQGRLILTKKLEAGNLNVIKTPNIKTAIYMLFVKDNDKIQGFKIPVTE